MTPDEVAERLLAAPARAGVILDFDGTLAPIVADPTDSQMPASLRPVLAALARRFAVCAVVSGRPASFLGERVQAEAVVLLGLYGLEQWRDGRSVPLDEALPWADAVTTAAARLHERFDDADGVWVEDKGLAVAVHWRRAADRDRAAREVDAAVRALAAETGLAREPGKLVEELRPPLTANKGTAVAGLVERHRLATLVYVGDDLGDLPAFAAARDAGGIAVGVDAADETPSAVLEAVDAVLPSTDAVAQWLAGLAR